MTVREAEQYESQGWPHIHMWKEDHGPYDTIQYYGIIRHVCRCGSVMIQRGDFMHIIKWK